MGTTTIKKETLGPAFLRFLADLGPVILDRPLSKEAFMDLSNRFPELQNQLLSLTNLLIMATEKFTIEQLKRRKKSGSVLLVILTIAAIAGILVVIYDLIIGDGLNTPLFISVMACFMISIPIYLGKKKIDLVLKNKEGS